jgi:hypothetical protein
MKTTQSAQDNDLERLARKRAGAKMSWYIHAMVYVLVNLMLLALSGMSDRPWAIFPALGWGLGLLIHGAAVFVALPGGGLHERLMQQERERLTQARDPW